MQFEPHEAAFRPAARLHSRRDLPTRLGAGIEKIGLAGLLGQSCALGAPVGDSPLLPKALHFAPRAKHVIQLFMPGGPSQVDTANYKPHLAGGGVKRGFSYGAMDEFGCSAVRRPRSHP
jgi:hypothetical protein